MPVYYPASPICWNCKKDILKDYIENNTTTKAASELDYIESLVLRCPHCKISYVVKL